MIYGNFSNINGDSNQKYYLGTYLYVEYTQSSTYCQNRMEPYIVRITEFLDRKGSTEVLLTADPDGGMKHSEFKSEIDVARSTVGTRLNKAKDLRLLEVVESDEEHGNSELLTLSQLGRVLRVALESIEHDKTYQKYIEKRQQLDDEIDTIQDWIIENDEFWSSIDLDDEFILDDELKSEESYPGKNTRSDLDRFISEPKSLREQLQEAVENRDNSYYQDEGDETEN